MSCSAKFIRLALLVTVERIKIKTKNNIMSTKSEYMLLFVIPNADNQISDSEIKHGCRKGLCPD